MNMYLLIGSLLCFSSVVIGLTDNFGFGFTTLRWKLLQLKIYNLPDTEISFQ